MNYTRDDVIDFVDDHIDHIHRMHDQDVPSDGVEIIRDDTNIKMLIRYYFRAAFVKPRFMNLLNTNQQFRTDVANEVRRNFVEGIVTDCFLIKSRCWCLHFRTCSPIDD